MNRILSPMAALFALLLAVGFAPTSQADVKMSHLFGDHMVLQQGLPDRVWGKADPGEKVTVAIAGQTKATEADNQGQWMVTLDPLPVGGPHTLTVTARNTLTFNDVLVGEVWLCSGQSNMEWDVRSANDADLESLAAKLPKIRMISVPQVGTQEPQADFQGKWDVCTPESVKSFSAVGYFFGRQLQQTLEVPIGLIDDSWGGSACEAWIRRDVLTKNDATRPLVERWEGMEKEFPKAMEEHAGKLKTYREQAESARAEGKRPPRPPQSPEAQMTGNARPANLYNGVLKPLIGYGMRGAIWYQGETNAGRAYQYREMFPMMIQNWREDWKIGDFPFYWVQLADYQAEKPEPGPSAWAELREAQTMTMKKLPHTGEAVIIDLGEAQDIHPRNKQIVAKRLARWALKNEYGIDIACQSPTYTSMEKSEAKIILAIEHVGGGLKPFDTATIEGFTIAGEDQKFHPAKAKLVGKDKIEVSAENVPNPVAVRYAWADNPVCNLYSREGLPLTPFRTDDWPGVTANQK